jgi:hypothetical protein
MNVSPSSEHMTHDFTIGLLYTGAPPRRRDRFAKFAQEVIDCSPFGVRVEVSAGYFKQPGLVVDFYADPVRENDEHWRMENGATPQAALADAMRMFRSMAGPPQRVKWEGLTDLVRQDLSNIGKGIKPTGVSPLYDVIDV